MPNPNWTIRIYKEIFVESEQKWHKKLISYVGSFKEFGNRQQDDVIVFKGLYGSKSYLIWIIHNNVEDYSFGYAKLDLKLFHSGTKRGFFQEYFIVRDVYYDSDISKYVLFAESEDSILLDMDLAEIGIQSLSYDANRTGIQVLEDVLTKSGLLGVRYQDHPNKQLVEKEYRTMTFPLHWKVYDLIERICEDNGWEWYVSDKILFISKELKIIKEKRSSKKQDETTNNISEAGFIRKYKGNYIPLDVMSHIAERWRCVWFKHAVGSCGGISKACFTRRGMGRITRQRYFESLEDDLEKDDFNWRMHRKAYIHSRSLMLGNIIKDLGETKYIDQISIQRNADVLKTTYPNDVLIDDDNNGQETQVVFAKEQVCRMSPYYDHNGGLLLPSPVLDNKAPNSVLGQIEGKENAPIHMGYLPGNGTDNLELPDKPQPEDLKLILPNGWCFFIDGITGETIIVPSGAALSGKPTASGTYIQIDSSGNVNICGTDVLAKGDHVHAAGSLLDSLGAPCTGSTGGSNSNTEKLKGG